MEIKNCFVTGGSWQGCLQRRDEGGRGRGAPFFTLIIIFIWHQGYFLLADIFIKEEEKMIAERISAEVFNEQDEVPQMAILYVKQGGWHGWRRFQLAKKEPESRHQHYFYFQIFSFKEKVGK